MARRNVMLTWLASSKQNCMSLRPKEADQLLRALECEHTASALTKLKHEVEQSTLQLFQHKIDEYHSRADMLIEQHRIESRIYVQEEDNIYIEEKENFQD